MASARIVSVGGTDQDRATLAGLLAAAGLREPSALSCAQAVEAAERGAADLILVDVMQPSADVLRLLKAGAARPGRAAVPVLVSGPPAAAERLNACLLRGAHDYVLTPYDSANGALVTRRIELTLQSKRLRELAGAHRSGGGDPDETAVLELYGDASSRFVPHEFLEHLERKSLVEVKLGDHVLRDMTVFFSDIRDFTTLSEKMTPQENFDFLNSYLQQVTPIIRSHHGFIDKYIGDAIMALFSKGATDALRAGVELQRQVARYNLGRQAAGYEGIRIGIGMHRGALILGTVGEQERMQTTVIADAVNLASRIEGLTKVFGSSLLVSGEVVEALDRPDAFKLRNLGAVKAKGKTQSVEIFECYDNDPDDLAEHKRRTAGLFEAAMNEFRRGMFLTAGSGFARVAELNRADAPAAYYRDRCSLTAVRGRGPGPWDGAELIEVK